MDDRPLCAVILAAGEGKRMRSSRPKPLHLLCGRPMVVHVLDSLAHLEADWAVMVVGHGGEHVVRTMNDAAPVDLPLHFVEQRVQRGTGDAVAIAMASLPAEVSDEAEDADIVIIPGDTPLLEAETVASLVQQHRSSGAAATILTVELDNPTGYGRIIRDRRGRVTSIVEERDGTDEERAVKEVNTSVICFRTYLLGAALRKVTASNAQNEVYLTDAIGILADAGHQIETIIAPDIAWAVGVNDRTQLASAEAELRRRINQEWMSNGVTMVDPEHTYVDFDVELDPDVSLLPGTRLRGNTTVGAGSEIGPHATLESCQVGKGAHIVRTDAVETTFGDNVRVGPYVVAEPGTEVESGVTVPPFTHLVAADDADQVPDQ